MNQKTISVCITTYNGENYIAEQISSIMSQLDVADEVIISDDGSSDNTLEILSSFNDNRIKIHHNAGKKGSTPNFENALKLSTGDYIFLSDQDDIWSDNKVEMCIKYLENYDFIVSDATIIDHGGNILYDSFFAVRKPRKSLSGNLLKFGYLGCCFAFKRSIIKKSLPFPANYKLSTHDNWLFMVAKVFFRVKILNDKLILYRRHDFNLSSGGLTNQTTLFFKIKYRVYLFWNLLKRRLVK